jgi:hypothetical protein
MKTGCGLVTRGAPTKNAAAVAGGVLCLWLLGGMVQGAQMIDRVLAVVAGEPITLSDVTAAMRLGLVAEAPVSDDPTRVALDALIERQLQLIEVDRYAPPEPSEADIDARIEQINGRFESPTAIETALRETGVTAAQVRARVRDTLRIESYLQQRFGASYQPSDEEIARYYRTNEAAFVRGGALQPFDQVREDARKRLIDARTASLVRDWVEGLRRRTDVTILPK